MVDTVVVHIGPHKTGTTFLQKVLDRNRGVLAEHGVHFVGQSYQQQLDAVGSLLGRRRAKARPGPDRWDQLVRMVDGLPDGTAVISHESLSSAGDHVIERLVRTLQPRELHVVVTLRDLARVIPGRWQTHVRSRGRHSWAEFVASVRGDPDADPGLGSRFWRAQDPRELFPRWERHLPGDHLHVVTVPPADHDPALLWSRFASLLGQELPDVSLEVARSNPSVGAAEAEVLRQLNNKGARDIRPSTYDGWVKVLAGHTLERRTQTQRITLPAEELSWLRPRAEQIVEFLRGYDVRGDLRELVPPTPAAGSPAPDEVDAAVALDAATDVMVAMLHRIERQIARLRRAEAAARPPQRPEQPAAHRLLGRARSAGRRTATGIRRRLARRNPRR